MGTPATAELRAQHRQVERILSVASRLATRLERGQECPLDDLRSCLDLMRVYADACHHGDEEDVLFALLERRAADHPGASLRCMRAEHDNGRSLVATLRETLPEVAAGAADARGRFCEAARQYVALLLQHINKEDRLLFTLADEVLTPEEAQQLTRAALQRRQDSYEGLSRAEWEGRIAALADRWQQRGRKRQAPGKRGKRGRTEREGE